MLEAENITVRYGDLEIVRGISFHLTRGEWLMVVGPNGAGKSTLVSAISGGVKYAGRLSWEGRDISSMPPALLAKKMGVLSQSRFVGYPFSVEEVVHLGRYAHAKGPLAAQPEEDSRMVESALKLTGMAGLRRQSILTLSGGELQRTFLAQVFAQDPELLILDEPTNHLDLPYQKQLFELIRGWVSHAGRSVISVVHDLSLAKAYGSTALLMDHGRIAAYGPAGSVLTPSELDRVYGMDVQSWMLGMLKQWE